MIMYMPLQMFSLVGEINLTKYLSATKAGTLPALKAQAQKDDVRGTVVDYAAYQSKKSQVEIYLSVATDSNVEIGNDTATILESLRETQKQNNTVQAYAQYQENQQGAVHF